MLTEDRVRHLYVGAWARARLVTKGIALPESAKVDHVRFAMRDVGGDEIWLTLKGRTKWITIKDLHKDFPSNELITKLRLIMD